MQYVSPHIFAQSSGQVLIVSFPVHVPSPQIGAQSSWQFAGVSSPLHCLSPQYVVPPVADSNLIVAVCIVVFWSELFVAFIQIVCVCGSFVPALMLKV